MEVKKLCWELVFDWMIRRNEQQTSGSLNAATFLVRGALRALFFTFPRILIQPEYWIFSFYIFQFLVK